MNKIHMNARNRRHQVRSVIQISNTQTSTNKNKDNGYNTSGKVHKIGVENEYFVLRKIEENIKSKEFKEVLKEEFGNTKFKSMEHLGGTHNKSDGNINVKNGGKLSISIKNHKFGSFDYLNTSKIHLLIGEKNTIKYNKKLENIKEAMSKKYSQSPENDKKNIIEDTRIQVFDLAKEMFGSFSSELIKKFIKDSISKDSKILAITDVKNGEIAIMKNSERIDYKTFGNGNNYEVKPLTNRTKCSQTMFVDGKQSNMRFRITLNNGIGALIGSSHSNKDSIWTIKIQNDDVRWLLDKSERIMTLKY